MSHQYIGDMLMCQTGRVDDGQQSMAGAGLDRGVSAELQMSIESLSKAANAAGYAMALSDDGDDGYAADRREALQASVRQERMPVAAPAASVPAQSWTLGSVSHALKSTLGLISRRAHA